MNHPVLQRVPKSDENDLFLAGIGGCTALQTLTMERCLALQLLPEGNLNHSTNHEPTFGLFSSVGIGQLKSLTSLNLSGDPYSDKKMKLQSLPESKLPSLNHRTISMNHPDLQRALVRRVTCHKVDIACRHWWMHSPPGSSSWWLWRAAVTGRK